MPSGNAVTNFCFAIFIILFSINGRPFKYSIIRKNKIMTNQTNIDSLTQISISIKISMLDQSFDFYPEF